MHTVRTVRNFALSLPLIAVLAAGAAFATVGANVSAQTTQPAQQAQPRHRLFGAITSVSAGTVVVTGRDGKPVTVRVTSDTRIYERAAAHLAEIHSGDKVRIVARKAQDGSLTALAVEDTPSDLAIGGRSRSGVREMPSGKVFISGAVVSVGETSLSVASASGSSTTVAVSSNARIQRLTALSPAGLSTGMRLVVQGTGNPDGSLTASVILVAGKARQ
jgi:Domain of unknown function (DUF5666)